MPRSTSVLDKPYGHPRDPEYLARLTLAKEKLLAGTLEYGEMSRLVFGIDDVVEYLQRPASNPVMARTLCLDCSKPVVWAGAPLASERRRCLPCGRNKRRAYKNLPTLSLEDALNIGRGRPTVAPEPQEPVSAPDLLVDQAAPVGELDIPILENLPEVVRNGESFRTPGFPVGIDVELQPDHDTLAPLNEMDIPILVATPEPEPATINPFEEARQRWLASQQQAGTDEGSSQ